MTRRRIAPLLVGRRIRRVRTTADSYLFLTRPAVLRGAQRCVAFAAPFAFQALEKVPRRDIQNFAKLPHFAGANTIGAAFVFLYLLEADSKLAGELFLRKPTQFAPRAHLASYMDIDRMWHC